VNWEEAKDTITFVVGFCGFVYLLLCIIDAYRSPKLKSDMEQLRENRRRAKAAKRK
jgi:hypothetical protein